jgi:hypothetical protein
MQLVRVASPAQDMNHTAHSWRRTMGGIGQRFRRDWGTGGLGDWETGGLGDWETGGLGDWGTWRVGEKRWG